MATSIFSVKSACQLVNVAVRRNMTRIYRGSVAAIAMSEHDYRLACTKAQRHGIELMVTVQPNQKGQGIAEFMVALAVFVLLALAVVAFLDLPALGSLKEIASFLNSL